jgi:hypothetical protein
MQSRISCLGLELRVLNQKGSFHELKKIRFLTSWFSEYQVFKMMSTCREKVITKLPSPIIDDGEI